MYMIKSIYDNIMDYRGEIMVILHNSSTEGVGTQNTIHIKAGDRIAQAVLAPVINGSMVEIEEGTVDELETERGSNGFGSTGIR